MSDLFRARTCLLCTEKPSLEFLLKPEREDRGCVF